MGKLAASSTQQTPAQRAVLNRHQQVPRSLSGPAPRLLQPQKASSSLVSSQSPKLQPTRPAITSSPTTSRSPNYAFQGGMTSPRGVFQAQSQQQLQHQHQQQQSQPQLRPTSRSNMQAYPGITIPTSNPNLQSVAPVSATGHAVDARGIAAAPRPNHWPSSYQSHIEQLGKLTRPLLSLLFQ